MPYRPGVPRPRPAPSTRPEPRPPSAASSRAARPGPGGRAGQPGPGVPLAERARSFAANLARITGQPTRIKPTGTRCCAGGRRRRGPRLRRPAPLAARRSAPGEHSGERRPGQRRDRLRRHQPRATSASDLSVAWSRAAPARLPYPLLVGLPGPRPGLGPRHPDGHGPAAGHEPRNRVPGPLRKTIRSSLEADRRTLSTVLEDQRGPAG